MTEQIDKASLDSQTYGIRNSEIVNAAHLRFIEYMNGSSDILKRGIFPECGQAGILLGKMLQVDEEAGNGLTHITERLHQVETMLNTTFDDTQTSQVYQMLIETWREGDAVETWYRQNQANRPGPV